VPRQPFCLGHATMARPGAIPRSENSSPTGMLCGLI